MDPVLEQLEQLLSRMSRLEAVIRTLVEQRTIKDWYSTDEVASVLGKAPFTVREWCRLGRVYAAKRECGRGNTAEWVVSHEELERIRNHGLLPIATYRHVR